MILASVSALVPTLTLLAALAYGVPALLPPHKDRLAGVVLMLAWALHALLLLSGLAGDLPRFGFASALSVTAWLVATVYLVEMRFYPQLRWHWSLCLMGALAVLLAWVFPGSLLPERTSGWLPLHLALGIGSYALFGVAVVHAVVMGRAEDSMRAAAAPGGGLPLLTLERLTFRFVMAGFVLLTVTLLSALVFGEALYGGRAVLRWDHKSVFSVLSWLVFAALMLGRMRFGWRGRRATRMLYAGSGLLLLAYVGSRFVLEVVLGRNT